MVNFYLWVQDYRNGVNSVFFAFCVLHFPLASVILFAVSTPTITPEMRDLLAITLLGEGFEAAVASCGSCELVDTVSFSTGDLLDGTLPQKVASAIVAHPEADAISFPYAAAVQLGLAGIADAGRDDLLVMGAEGMPSQYDLLAGGQIDMVMAFPADWTGWAAIDTLNRIFQGAEIVDEGVGYQLLTADELGPGNEPPAPPYDFEATYREVWGV